jgi:hypothetical protein
LLGRADRRWLERFAIEEQGDAMAVGTKDDDEKEIERTTSKQT